MPKKKSLPPPVLDQSVEFPKFLDVESAVFTLYKDNMFIGRELITPQLRSLLRDEAKSLQSTRLWEILNASVINEAFTLALNQSQNFDNVQFAKAMYQWSKFIMNVMNILAKE